MALERRSSYFVGHATPTGLGRALLERGASNKIVEVHTHLFPLGGLVARRRPHSTAVMLRSSRNVPLIVARSVPGAYRRDATLT